MPAYRRKENGNGLAPRERASLRAHAHRERPSYEDINHALSWTMLAITHA